MLSEVAMEESMELAGLAESRRREALTHIFDWSLTTGVMPPAHRLTLMAIARHAGADGKCSPTQSTISRMTGSTRQTVSRHVQYLVAMGMLEVTPLITDRGLRTEYLLTGVYNNWVPEPKDPNRKPKVLRVPTTKVAALEEHVDTLNAKTETGE